MTQPFDWDNIKYFLQLIREISRVFQKLLKYFHDAAISTIVVLPSAGLPLLLFLLGIEMVKSLLCEYLKHRCSTAINFLMFLYNYCWNLLNYALASQLLHFLLVHY